MELLVDGLAHLLELRRVVLLQALEALLERVARFFGRSSLLVLHPAEVLVEASAQALHLAVLCGGSRAHLRGQRLAEGREAPGKLLACFALGAPRPQHENRK